MIFRIGYFREERKEFMINISCSSYLFIYLLLFFVAYEIRRGIAN